MGQIIILEETTKHPITLMGSRAGICWGSDVSDREKNYKRGLECLVSGHGRVMEYVNVEMVLDGYQQFAYVIPPAIAHNEEARSRYEQTMQTISKTCRYLEESCGIKREDAALLLPLGMATKIVDRRNLRSLVDMSRQRMCSRAYHEYREMFGDICGKLAEWSEEWAYLVEHFFMPKCEALGYCPEKRSCGRMPQKVR